MCILATLSNAFSTLYVSPSGEGTTQKEFNEIDIKVREDKRLVGLKVHQDGVKLVDSLVCLERRTDATALRHSRELVGLKPS